MPPCFFLFCLLIAPPAPGMVPDGAGGYVPVTNSRVMPDGSLRSYDPYSDGGYVRAPPPVVLVYPPVAPAPGYWVEPYASPNWGQ